MELIYYQGLNCRLASIANVAELLGVGHEGAFANLWSETDFSYETQYDIYVSRRLPGNLRTIGLQVESATENLSQMVARVSDGGLVVVGMDYYYMPWHQMYRHFHGQHFFFARRLGEDMFTCYDPVYGDQNMMMCTDEIVNLSFEICHVERVASRSQPSVFAEACAVLDTHPHTISRLDSMLDGLADGGSITNTCRLLCAMINNRRLFQRYLHAAKVLPNAERFFSDPFLSRWEAVRFGAHKATVVTDRRPVVDEVRRHLREVMTEEMTMASTIAALQE